MSGCLLFVPLLPALDGPFLVIDSDEYLNDLVGVLFKSLLLVFLLSPTFVSYIYYLHTYKLD